MLIALSRFLGMYGSSLNQEIPSGFQEAYRKIYRISIVNRNYAQIQKVTCVAAES